jgi:hypothetical protein
MMAMNLALPSERFNGFRPAHRQRKACLLDWGIVPHLSNASQRIFFCILCGAMGTFPAAAAMLMWGCCRWPLVVGHLRRHKAHMQIGIVLIYNS